MNKFDLIFKKPGDSTCLHVSFFRITKCTRPHLQSDEYCILHSKNPNKDSSSFMHAIKEKLVEKDYDFSDVFFPKSFSFVDYNFETEAIFCNVTFAGGVYFMRANFKKEVYFNGATFLSGALFFNTVFDDRTSFKNSKFYVAPYFNDAYFRFEANFKKVTFSKKVFFIKTAFLSESYFDESYFTDFASFEKAKFVGDASFLQSNFAGGASFSNAIISKVIFELATFHKQTSFIKAKFDSDSIFALVKFNDETIFEDVNFSGNVKFDETIFNGTVSFAGSTISGIFLFNRINDKGLTGYKNPFMADFTLVTILHSSVLRFQDLSLSYVNFSGTDMLKPEFRHVTWRLYRGRQAVYDEVLINQKEPNIFNRLLCLITNKNCGPSGDEYARVEELYRYLKLNYEREGDYKQAGDFHYGEMEMHRRASKWRWFPFYWNNLYRVLSGYGEQPLRALGWLFIFLVGMAGLVWELGLEVGNPPHLAGFGDSFIYLLQKATLQRPTWADPAGFGGKLAAGFSVLLIPGQAALFLLALRNRLGRRR